MVLGGHVVLGLGAAVLVVAGAVACESLKQGRGFRGLAVFSGAQQ